MQQFHMLITWRLCDQQHCYHHAPTEKPEANNAVVELLMMGVEEPETCWATRKGQVINLWNCCIYLVNLFELKLIFRNQISIREEINSALNSDNDRYHLVQHVPFGIWYPKIYENYNI
jgi:hypothetical protein